MARPRKEIVSLESTPYYHCISRCVRNAYLCGDDHFSGRNYNHRKQWLVVRLQQLASVFAIDVCGYSIMSNHYHTVLHVNQSEAAALSERDVATRWSSIFKGHSAVDGWLEDKPLNKHEQLVVDKLLVEWRERLTDISWFMRCMNENIARKANREDGCSGSFWIPRFTSQPLLDEAALLACMTYVDLNPIRAGICETPEESDFTSVQSRLCDHLKSEELTEVQPSEALQAIEKRIEAQEAALSIETIESLPQMDLPRAPLMPFDGCSSTPTDTALPFSLTDHFELVEMTGRIIREDKKGFIPAEIPSLIDRLNIKSDKWIYTIKRYGSMFTVAASTSDRIREHAAVFKNVRWFKGVGREDLVKKSAYG